MFVKASTLSAGAETNCLSCFVKKLRNPVSYSIASLTRRSEGFLLSFPLSRPPRILSGIKKKKRNKKVGGAHTVAVRVIGHTRRQIILVK
jgi:hypothetical protein